MMERCFPVFISLKDKHVLLVGAGTIASRRADGLLRFGAEVTVIAPDWKEQMLQLAEEYPNQLRKICRGFENGDCEGYAMVLSASSDPQIDLQVYEEAKRLGIPVNIASDQTKCDFYFPALVEQDDIVMGVTSGGKDHHKVRRVSAALRSFMKAYSENEE